METLIPWALALLIVFVGMAILLWRALANQHETVRLLAQLLSSAALPRPVETLSPLPVKPPATLQTTAESLVKPTLPKYLEPAPRPALAPPEASGPPPWFQWALHEIGFHETGTNQGIERYIGLAHCGALGDPWCAIFANAALESSGVPGTRSASSQSFRSHPAFAKLDGPALGAIAVFWRGAPDSGLGHVGFYRGEDANRVWTLGGNENDMVQIEALPKSSATFGLIGYWWPKSVPLPKIGPILMPAGSPVSIQTPPAVAGKFPSTDQALPAGGSFTSPSKGESVSTEFRAMVPGGYFSSSPFDKSIPASIRTNNPGALNVASWIKDAPGYVGDKVTSMSGAEPNSTVIFSAPEYGVAAWFTLLQKYRAAGATTVSAIINRYGGGQDYSGYVGQVAAWSGLGEQAVINLDGEDAALLAFAKAMFRYEAGRPSPLSDAQILYGFNLARSRAPTSPLAEPSTPKVT